MVDAHDNAQGNSFAPQKYQTTTTTRMIKLVTTFSNPTVTPKRLASTCNRVDEAGNEPTMVIHYRNARGWNERLASTKLGARFEYIALQNEVWNIQSDDQSDGVQNAKFAAEVTVVYGDL